MTIAEKRKEYRLINILFKTIYKKKSAKWRGDYLRKKHIFHHIGENVHLWGGIPSDPYLISIGNNVIIAVSVEFVTHDIFYHALNQTYSDLGKFYPHFDTITIEDNVWHTDFMIVVAVKNSCMWFMELIMQRTIEKIRKDMRT